jgi:uncharacterized protein YjbJ (UPF0337 family)
MLHRLVLHREDAMSINRSQLRGRTTEMQGRINEIAGKILGNRRLQAIGRLQSILGKSTASRLTEPHQSLYRREPCQGAYSARAAGPLNAGERRALDPSETQIAVTTTMILIRHRDSGCREQQHSETKHRLHGASFEFLPNATAHSHCRPLGQSVHPDSVR